MSLSQDERYGPLLTNEQLYHQDLAQLRILSDEEEEQLLARVRLSEADPQEIVVSLLVHVKCMARRYYWYLRNLLGWDIWRVEYADLVEEANVALVEYLPRALLRDNPFSYLLLKAHTALLNYTRTYQSLIKTPTATQKYQAAEEPLKVESLDRPRDDDEEWALFHIIAVSVILPGAEVPRDYQELHQAIETALTSREKETIIRTFGLFGYPEETPGNLQSEWYGRPGTSTVSNISTQALMKLGVALTGELDIRERTPKRQTPHVQLTDEQQRKLDHAYQEMRERRERISGRALQKRAHVGSEAAQSYIYQRRLASAPPVSRQERLATAYAALEQSGQPITAERLAKTAHVDERPASLYLQHRRRIDSKQQSS